MIPLYEKFAGILFMDNVIDESISRDVIKVIKDVKGLLLNILLKPNNIISFKFDILACIS